MKNNNKKCFKLPFATQLLLLFVVILSLAGFIFSSLTLSKTAEYAKTATISRLSSVIEASKNEWNSNSEEFTLSEDSDFPIAYVRYTKSGRKQNTGDPNNMWDPSSYSENITDIAPQAAIEEIVSKIDPSPSHEGNGTIKYGKKQYYYAYAFSSPMEGNGILVITNSHYAYATRHKMAVEYIFIFMILFAMSAVIIFIWSSYYTTRLHRLKTHVNKLPKNNYQDEYLDKGHDELTELSEAIEGMRMELYNAEDQKKEMLHNLSHDFKTPISVIKSYAEAIKDGVEGQDGLDVILGQCDLLQSKVTKLLQYNRLEYLSKDKEFEDIKLKSVIENVILTYKHRADINVQLELDDSTFKGYEENYYTVIDNIIDNQFRYAKGVISIKVTEGELYIYNDGEHIEEKFLNGLFKAYEKGSKGQFGLGMSIVKKTLDFFGYDIEVKNEEVGVQFHIYKHKNQNISTL